MPDLHSLYTPRAQFLPFHERSQRWATLVCHRRAGKTVAGVNEIIERGIYTKKPNARYSYIAPFYAQAKAVAWDYLLQFSAPFRKKANIAELSVDLFNGSRCRLFGGDNPDALRGLYHDGVLLDEPAQMKPRLWPEIIRPALSDRKGWAVFMGTPRGKNEFWEIVEGAKKDPEWFLMILKASESGILDQKELDAARGMMDEDEYNQEYECSFDAAIRGSFYGKQINTMGSRLGSWPFTPGHKVHTCWDLGFTDDTVIWFFQVIHSRPIFFDCYAASGQKLSVYVDALHSARENYGKLCPPDQPFEFGEFYLPHDARAHSLQTGKSMQEDLLKHDVRARIVPELSVQDGIQATRKLLDVCCIDETKCFVGVEALRQYQREWDEDKKTFRQKPRHDWTSHYADGLRMGAIGYREDYTPPAVFVPPRLRPRALITQGMQLNELWKQIPLNPRRSNRI
jgi:hypothetical protein